MIRVGDDGQARATWYAEDVKEKRPHQRQVTKLSLCARVTNFVRGTLEIISTNTVPNRMCATGFLILGTAKTFWGVYCLGTDDPGFYCTHTLSGEEMGFNWMVSSALISSLADFSLSVFILRSRRVFQYESQEA